MERLPDFLMLDFCEWLKRTILNKAQYSNIDMWDLLFDERYEKFLLEKTEEYCNRERKQKNPNSNDNIKKRVITTKCGLQGGADGWGDRLGGFRNGER